MGEEGPCHTSCLQDLAPTWADCREGRPVGGMQLGHSLPCQDREGALEENVCNSVGCLEDLVSGEHQGMEMGAE